MKVAVAGCVHGEMDKMYESLMHIQQRHGIQIDLVLCCGDFQAVRNRADLETMSVPVKYRSRGTFYKYYSGEKKAPILTLFVGGNHEATLHLQQLPWGGWVAPNIYYMGWAGVVDFAGLSIAGISGTFKHYHYPQSLSSFLSFPPSLLSHADSDPDQPTDHHELYPYSEDEKRSAYHQRMIDVFRLSQVCTNNDLKVSNWR